MPEQYQYERIHDFIVEILEKEPQGLRYSEIVSRVSKWNPSLPEGSIMGAVNGLVSERPDEVYKPSKGLYQLTKFKQPGVGRDEALPSGEGGPPSASAARGEDALYKPFADYLVDGLEECTKAIPVGGNSFGPKWGTPDVMGVLRARESHIYKPTMEVVSAEIKTDSSQLVIAFGQACAYTLFSHRVYLVVPRDASKEDVDRLTSLCQIFGLGLVLVDQTATPPIFNPVLRAARHEPDAYYVNQVLPKVESKLLH